MTSECAGNRYRGCQTGSITMTVVCGTQKPGLHWNAKTVRLLWSAMVGMMTQQ